MNPLDDIFQEYVRIREYGLDVHEALRALKIYVEPLKREQREQLAQYLRSWEAEKLAHPENTARKLNQLKRVMPAHPTSEFAWVNCPNCGRKNREKDVFCYRCSSLLQTTLGEMTTLDLQLHRDEAIDKEYFGPNSVLILEAKNSDGYYEVRPQLENRELTLGRDLEERKGVVDINVGNSKELALGVSRMHLGITYDKQSETLQLHDLGSSNGTFINGQRLHPSERRALSHGDELSLGRLILNVTFLHPNNKR